MKNFKKILTALLVALALTATPLAALAAEPDEPCKTTEAQVYEAAKTEMHKAEKTEDYEATEPKNQGYEADESTDNQNGQSVFLHIYNHPFVIY